MRDIIAIIGILIIAESIVIKAVNISGDSAEKILLAVVSGILGLIGGYALKAVQGGGPDNV